MQSEFLQQQWQLLCERVQRCANEGTESSGEETTNREAQEFVEQEPPTSYKEYLERVQDAARLGISWHGDQEPGAVEQSQKPSENKATSDQREVHPGEAGARQVDEVDESIDESFPASDPPAWTR